MTERAGGLVVVCFFMCLMTEVQVGVAALKPLITGTWLTGSDLFFSK